MQYVRSISGSVSKTWNSINPATLSGAIDVIVVEHEDEILACSPFHVRFGKFSLLRPHEKKVDFRVNDVKQDFPMKLGEGGEAFFVFETTNNIPEALQTSPLVSPVASPDIRPGSASVPALAEPEPLELEGNQHDLREENEEQSSAENGMPIPQSGRRTHTDPGEPLEMNIRDVPLMSIGDVGTLSKSLDENMKLPVPTNFASRAMLPTLQRHNTDHALPAEKVTLSQSFESHSNVPRSAHRHPSPLGHQTERSSSPPPLTSEEAMSRAINLSKKLWGSNIPSQVTEKGDLMLDMTGYKSSEEEGLQAEIIARKILSEELEGNWDIGSLIGADEKGNLWIYSSEEAKEEADRRAAAEAHDLPPAAYTLTSDTASDPGYHSDDARSDTDVELPRRIQHIRYDSDSAVGMSSPPYSPDAHTSADQSRNYAKTLRLTSDQLKALKLKPGLNTMSFTVNRATCTANLWLWRYDVPIVISDIDGTITKSDALGHVLNMIGRDWTHLGVAKLYTDIAANGYNIMYLTSRSIGQADTTRTYLSNIVQEGGHRLPRGPVILSPDRTIAALRREIYLRKPEVFKMACLRDIMALFHGLGGTSKMFVDPQVPTTQTGRRSLDNARSNKSGSPFYAGFGNRLTDALSYRSVNIPSTRIFTINSSAEVTLDLLSLNTYKTGYTSMREIVDHFFPPVGLLVKGGGEDFTDFNYWRDKPLEIEDFSASESEVEDEDDDDEDIDTDSPTRTRVRPSEDEGGMNESFISETNPAFGRSSLEESILESIEGDEGRSDEDDEDDLTDDADDEDEEVVGSLELDDQQNHAQDELRSDLKNLAKKLVSSESKAGDRMRGT